MATSLTIDALLGTPGGLDVALRGPAVGLSPDGAPIGTQEIWAAAVTYKRSRDARVPESGTPDPYQRIY